MTMLDTPSLSSPPDPTKSSPWATAIRFGAMWAGASILVGLLIFLLTPTGESPENNPLAMVMGLITMLFPVVFVVLAVLRHRNIDLGGFMDAGRGLRIGFFTGLVAGAIGLVWTILDSTVINPAALEMGREAIERSFEDQPDAPEWAYSFAMIFVNPFVLGILVLIARMFAGFLFGLIAGAILNK